MRSRRVPGAETRRETAFELHQALGEVRQRRLERYTMSDSGLPARGSSLDPQDWDAFRLQAHSMLDDMLSFTQGIRERPVWQVIPEEARARFRSPLPVAPTSLAEVHAEFMTAILPFAVGNAHPGFMGWVQGGGTPVGMLAEMLAAGLNANVGGRDQVPLEVERQVTAWMRTLFGFPEGASGIFVTGTSMANFLAVLVARNALLGPDVRRMGLVTEAPRLAAYASVAAHGSVGRALDFAGLGSDSLRLVAVDVDYRMDLRALEEKIKADREAGWTPFLVVGSAGTVDTGAIDDLAGVASICEREQLWFHVDGAFGALAMLMPELAVRLEGIDRADSLAFDFHKWAQVPYDAGFLLVRDGGLHLQAFSTSCAYLAREDRGMSAGSPWPCDLGLDLSRGFRALKTWATLKVYGADAITAVIRQSCALARSLEARIAMEPELELLAPVALNIVCFRYRFQVQDASMTCEQADTLNRQIVVELQEAGEVAPSSTLIKGRVAIRAAIVNHRTTQTEIDTLVHETLAAGRRLRPRPAAAAKGGNQWEPSRANGVRVQQLDAQLAGGEELRVDVEVALRVERALLLAEVGRGLEARADHLRVLALDPLHRVNLLALGRLLVASGHHKAARAVYTETIEHYPDELVARVNLGGVLLETDDPAGACEQYRAALGIDPNFPQAHGGLYYGLSRLGRRVEAEQHRCKGFTQQHLFASPYRGDGQPMPILLLVSSNGGNIPIEKLLDDRIFQTYVIVADFYAGASPLPEHLLVVNGIGDADVAGEALIAAEALVARTGMPVLNTPQAVRATGRCANVGRLAGIAGLRVPATRAFAYADLAGDQGAALLAECGFSFPLLLRAPGFHMGQHFVRVDAAAELAPRVRELPGVAEESAELLAIEYLDARGADGFARKYRVMIIGGRIYPLHLALAADWKIHYFSADMAERPDHRAEEAAFLEDMPKAIGSKAMAALKRVQAELGLDYGGIDFGLNAQGDVLLFEANATMLVEQPAQDERWDYRRAAVARIQGAVREMLISRAGAACAENTLASSRRQRR